MTDNIETLPLPSNALRQYINARQTFASLRVAEAEAKNYRGSMLWRQIKGHTYLIRTTTRAAQTSLGPKSPETEAIYNKFMTGKAVVEERRAGLAKALYLHQRMNKALFVGRMDDKIIDILNGLRDAGLGDNFTVIGTNALYAYETAAGVRIDASYLATDDLDLLWDNRRKLSIAVPGALADGMIGLLRSIDKTFSLRPDQLYTAVNADGYEVDILRRMGPGSEKEPAQITQVEDDFWAVKAHNADWLLSAPKFSEVVVGSNGRMAEMNTVDPRAFALFKLWMAAQKSREPQKRVRDAKQANVVVGIINEHLPQLSFDDIHVFPSNVIELIPGKGNK
ncbi:MAG: GSU2403 family nucleotidyltransferase fold protein [Burkholderiaceae bacterium]